MSRKAEQLKPSSAPGTSRKDRAKAVIISSPEQSSNPQGEAHGNSVSWSFPNESSAQSSPTVPADKRDFSMSVNPSYEKSMMMERSTMMGRSTSMLSPEEIARRRAVELDDKRQREWLEFARLNRHEGVPQLGKVFLDLAFSSSNSSFSGAGEESVPTAATSVSRIVIELLSDALPRTCENFRDLCLGTGGWCAEHGGVKLDYADTRCTRIVPNVGAIFGDLGGVSLSASGSTIPDESYALRHSARGVVSMIGDGPNQVGSKFIITFGPAPQLDFKYVPFGRVIDGFNVLERLETVPCTAVTNIPVHPIVISLSGALTGKKPTLVAPLTPAAPKEKEKEKERDGRASGSVVMLVEAED